MNTRDAVFAWINAGAIERGDAEEALRVAGVLPDHAAWRRLIDRLLLWLGVVLLAAALIFFFAYNWQALGRYLRFGIAEAALLIAVGCAWRIGIDRDAGKAALFAAALCVGALLALVGQTYQTGADSWQLFFVWALAILPWCAIGRMPALWVLWLALLNISLVAYHDATRSIFDWVFDTRELLWLLLALNTVALLLWHAAATRIAWLQSHWPVRLLATAVAGIVAALGLWGVLEWRTGSAAAMVAWLALSAAAVWRYRLRERDLYILSIGALAAIVILTGALGNLLYGHGNASVGGLLVMALAIIGMTAAAAVWLRGVARERTA